MRAMLLTIQKKIKNEREMIYLTVYSEYEGWTYVFGDLETFIFELPKFINMLCVIEDGKMREEKIKGYQAVIKDKGNFNG